MKKILIILVVLFMVTESWAASSAVDQGSVKVAGMISFQSYSGDLYGSTGATRIIVTPGVDFFVANGFALGPVINIESTSQSGYTRTQIGFGLETFFYFGNSSVYPFLGARFTYNTTSSGGMSTGSMISIMPMIGITVMLSDAVGLDIAIGYSIDSYTPAGFGSSTSGGILGIQMGFSAFLF